MDLPNPNDLPAYVRAAAILMPGVAGLLASIAACFGVAQYKLAAEAEARLKKSASMENSIKASQHLSILMQRADGRALMTNGTLLPDGVASQKTAIVEIGRLCGLFEDLKPASLAGLRALRNSQTMAMLYPDLDATIKQIETLDVRR